jgi:hypothetical protein
MERDDRYTRLRAAVYGGPSDTWDRMPCPDGSGDNCETCGGGGQVPTWLKDPERVGKASARTWGWPG